MSKWDVIVIGGGPAGMMAAYAAACNGCGVLLLEKNEKLGKKLFITGKGRCNITNACDTADFLRNIVRNPKFLMSAIHRFSNDDLVTLLHENKLQTKVERGQRVFPASDKSSDVIKTLERMLRNTGVTCMLGQVVTGVEKQGESFQVKTQDGSHSAGAVVVATGGMSYPQTGSTGDGYTIARSFGHDVVAPVPALVPLEDAHGICANMQGLTLKNVGFTLYQGEKAVYTEQGELLFTHFGLSGPVVLSASSFIDHSEGAGKLYCTIDMKPALDEEKLDNRLLRDFEQNQNRQLKNYMPELLPTKLIAVFLREIHVDAKTPINQVTKAMRGKLVQGLKHFRIGIEGARPLDEAIVTAGGVDVKQVHPSSMQSRYVPGLYFAGEVLDTSGLTGGFNLQIAFSTGHLAGASVQK